ncbi:peroxiredoxin family protein [Desertivirga brevis]|uniref:peroxiredoxin family protein n=1 Tax=Desertivirga brevis TaxID=2810310 RepID=UPI001A95F02C|nr:TlpA disulfide reductase family protein [Pedobacter sp. SYSU D00873]
MKLISIVKHVSCWGLVLATGMSYAQTSLIAGKWRGVFFLRDGSEVPFNFEVTGSPSNPKVFLINGAERSPADRVTFKKDSIIIPIDQFENELAFMVIGKNRLSGLLRRQDERTPLQVDAKGEPILADHPGLPLKTIAEFGKTHRFTSSPIKPQVDLNGKWDVVFTNDEGVESKTVGVFQQEASKLTGTFLRTTGDARFLQGEVSGKEFRLSSFIGTGPHLITGAFLDQNTFEGESKTASGKSRIRGTRNPDAELPDAFSLTQVKKDNKSFDFNLPDVDGKVISIKDERFRNKPVILTMTGTWCPNCMDETAFLAPWYKQNKARGIEVISVYYERKADPEYLKKVLSRSREKYGIEYTQLIGGLTDKKSVVKSLPALENFVAFPTTIFIDRNGNVTKIHTGFNGPATGKYYEEFKTEFNKEVETLLMKK